MYESYQKFNAAKLACRACPVGMVYNRVILSCGQTSNPVVMVIGESPGAEEIVKGEPFVGKSGRLLRHTLNAYGLTADNTVITNVIPCRPKDNKFPSDPKIVEACVERWLRQEITILKPKFVLVVGGKALKFLLGMDGITKSRGKWVSMCFRGASSFSCLPTYHPSFVLRMKPTSKGAVILEHFQSDIMEVARAAKLVP